ncbi:MAG: NAD(P)/FAD-dependent oxidoreductase [Patescibacteria group bacterium]
MNFDVIVLGGGPGGAKAAKFLAEHGKKVALVEQHLVGGECLHYGCIPSKVFLYSAELFEKFQKISQFGIEMTGEVKLNFSALLERKKKVVEMLHRGLSASIEKSGVQILKGRGIVASDGTSVTLENGETLSAPHIVMATGSEPVVFSGMSGHTNRTIFDLTELPKSIVIVGGGVSGCEFASFFAAFGVTTTIVEKGERILPSEDPEISMEMTKLFARKNVKVLTGISYSAEAFPADCTLFCVGRKVANEFPPSVIVIGDAAKKSMLAYTAEKEGENAAKKILGISCEEDFIWPNTIFTHPEIASVGAKESDVPGALIGRATFAGNARALIEGERDGFVKVLIDPKTHAMLGAHVIGKNATLIIDKATLVVSEKISAEKFLNALHGHPVMSEVLKEAIENGIANASDFRKEDL